MIFNSIFSLVEKDFRIFFRSKIALFFVIFMPLLIIILSGYGFGSNETSKIKIGAYFQNNSEIGGKILEDFEKNNFLVKNFDSLEECIYSIKSSEVHVCLVFESMNISSSNSEEIIFYADYSRVNLVYSLIYLIGKDISLQSSELGSYLVQEVLDDLSKTRIFILKSEINLKDIQSDLVNSEEILLSFNNPISDLDLVINSLKSSSNISSVESEILKLELIKQSIKSNSQDINELISFNQDSQLKVQETLTDINNLNSSLKSRNRTADEMVSPLVFKIEPLLQNNSKRDFLFPILFALISLFGGVLLSSSFVLKNKKTKAYFRNFVTPNKDITFLLSNYLTPLIILFFQFGLIFVGSYFLFGMNFFKSPLEMFLILFFGWSVFISLGIFLGYLFKSEETIILSSVLISSFFMFFSNLIFPLENVSESLFRIAQYNPFVVFETMIKKVYLFNFDLYSLLDGFLVLGISFVVFFFLSWIMRKSTKRRL